MKIYLAFAVSAVITMVLLPPLIRYAAFLGLVDVSDDRKVHSGSMPRVGGVAIVVGSMLSVFSLSGEAAQFAPYIAAVAVLFVFGILDDRGNLDYRWKFLGQIIAAVLAVVGGNAVISVLPFFGLDPLPDFITVPFTIIVLVGVTNAINLADGLDGLAAGTTLLSVACIALLAHFADGQGVVLIALAICGSLLGFLRYNAYPARVFMGDTGSQFLGFTACYIAIELTQTVNTALNPALPLLILGLPLLDTLMVMAKRVRDGRSMFYPDNNHFHHQLLGRGLDHTDAVAVIYIIHGLFVFSAIMFRYQSDVFIVSLYAITTVFILGTTYWSGKVNWKGAGWGRNLHLTNLVRKYRVGEHLRLSANILVKYGLAVFLVCVPWIVSDVSEDLGWIAAILALLMLPRLVFEGRLRFIPLRIFMYASTASVLYLLAGPPSDSVLLSSFVQAVFFVSMAIACLYVISRDRSFVVNTTDLLVLLLVCVVVFLPDVLTIDVNMESAFLKLIVLFYGCELMASSMRSRWSVPVVASLAALVTIAFRGLF